VRVHLKPRIGGFRLTKLNGVHVDGLAAELQTDEVKQWAARHAVDALDSALRYAVKQKLIAANPVASVEKSKPKASEIDFLTEEQAKLVREVSIGSPDPPLLAAALGTGCR
jgi:site-specific recombinase XerD